METRRWTNPSQPQTLQIAVFLLYLNAVFGLLIPTAPILTLGAIAGAIGAYGIANSRRWGYQLAVASATVEVVLLVAFPLLDFGPELLFNVRYLIVIVVPIALFCALLHPESRDHQRIWFE
jgi:hypothetical protein